MKKNKTFKIISALLSLLLVFSSIPLTAYASENIECTYIDLQVPFYNGNDRVDNFHLSSTDFNHSATYNSKITTGFRIYFGDGVIINRDVKDTSVTFKSKATLSGVNNIKVRLYAYHMSTNTILARSDIQNYSTSGNDLTVEFNQNYDDVYIGFFILYSYSASNSVTFSISKPTITHYSANETNTNRTTSVIGGFINDLKESIAGFFNSLWQWLQSIITNISDGFSNVGNWFTQIGDRISGFFSNLTTSISGFFTDLKDKLQTLFTNITNSISVFFTDLFGRLQNWFANIGQWFTQIGDRISSFFEKLWNRIYWGNENGESEYQKPVINNKLTDILIQLASYQVRLSDSIVTIDDSAAQVSGYITTGTQLVNGIINVAGVGFTALIIFGLVFVLVRKVVGR